jgi:hypothetical protein
MDIRLDHHKIIDKYIDNTFDYIKNEIIYNKIYSYIIFRLKNHEDKNMVKKYLNDSFNNFIRSKNDLNTDLGLSRYSKFDSLINTDNIHFNNNFYDYYDYHNMDYYESIPKNILDYILKINIFDRNNPHKKNIIDTLFSINDNKLLVKIYDKISKIKINPNDNIINNIISYKNNIKYYLDESYYFNTCDIYNKNLNDKLNNDSFINKFR